MRDKRQISGSKDLESKTSDDRICKGSFDGKERGGGGGGSKVARRGKCRLHSAEDVDVIVGNYVG